MAEVTKAGCRGFTYKVELYVRLDIHQTTLLKECCEHHYDYKVKESGRCGPVNGLHNGALWFEEDAAKGELIPERSYYSPLSFNDIDTMVKALEQRHYHCKTPERIKIGNDLDTLLRAMLTTINQEYTRLMEARPSPVLTFMQSVPPPPFTAILDRPSCPSYHCPCDRCAWQRTEPEDPDRIF